MKWSDTQPGDVVLDVDSGLFPEAEDFVVLARDKLVFTILLLRDGKVSYEEFPNLEVPGYYRVMRGDLILQDW